MINLDLDPFGSLPFLNTNQGAAKLKEVSRSRSGKVMRSPAFVVQVIARDGTVRLSISRTEADAATGRLRGDISWDDLQRLKAEAGYGDWYAVEVFPPDDKVVNEQNMRHLWLLPASGLLFGKLIGIN